MIYGASGGVGTFAIQIARSLGAEVTAVCSRGNLDRARSLGADHFIDYSAEDFLTNGQHYDLILGVNGYRSIFDYRRALTPEGIYVMAGGSGVQIFQMAFPKPIAFRSGGKRARMLSLGPIHDDLVILKDLLDSGKVVPFIDRSYPLSEISEAFRYLAEGHARGKIVITI